MSKLSRRHQGLLLIWLAVVMFALIKLAPTRLYVAGDSRESLVTAQSILQHGTIRLDAYYPDDRPNTVVEEQGHLYYYFPLGTSLLSVPFVGVQLLRGEDMLVEAHNFALQKTLAALVVSLSAVLIYILCRRFVGQGLSLLFTVVFVFGSSIVSTMGTALWSIDFAFLFMLLALVILIYEPSGKSGRIAPVFLGGALFMAYLSRPSTLTLTLPLFVYVFLVRRSWFPGMAATFALLAAGLVLFSQNEFGQVLPSYYLTSRLNENSTFWTAVYGNLASPGRGMLLYSSFLLAILVGLLLVFQQVRHRPLFWLAAAWILIHLVSISQFWHWWGGWSFGSRLMTETLPAWLLIALLVWPAARTGLSRPVYVSLTAGFIALGAVAIYVNTVQGLFNPATVDWNRWHRPLARAEFPQAALMLDWKYPQFLASPQQLRARHAEYLFADSLQPLVLGESIDFGSESVSFEGWTAAKNSGHIDWRRSNGDVARIFFRVESLPTAEKAALAWQIAASSTRPYRVSVLLNGQHIGVIAASGDGAVTQHILPFDSSLLTPSVGRHYNTLEFRILDPPHPIGDQTSNSDRPMIDLTLHEVKLAAVH